MQEYVDAGEFTPKDKMVKSLKINLIYYLVFLVIGIVLVIYIKIAKDETDISTAAIFASNAFGTLLIVLLLGYALVMIPKRYFQRTNKELNLKYYQFQASYLEDQRNNLTIELEDLIKMVFVIISMGDVSSQIKVLCNQIVAECPKDLVSQAKGGMSYYGKSVFGEELTSGNVNMKKIVQLNQQIKKKMEELRRVDCKWDIVLQNAFFLEDVIESKHSVDWKIRSTFCVENKSSFTNFLDTIKWVWFVKAQPVFLMVCGILSILMSLIIVVGEIVIFEGFNIPLLSELVNSAAGFLLTEFFCLIPLSYLAICVYFALFNVNLAGMYGLYPHHQTDPGSLLFSGLNFSRVACPLTYNFLQMIGTDDTAFMQFMGLEGLDLAKAYAYFLWVLVILIIFNLFDCYGRIMSALGLTQFKFSDTFNDERIEEGKKLIYKGNSV
jgi:hypothetical protein